MPFDSFGFQVDSNLIVLALIEARAKIEDFDHWRVGSTGMTIVGEMVLATNKAAVKWCAVGAIKAVRPGVANRSVYDGAMRYLRCAARAVGGPDSVPQGVNDDMGHWATLQMFDNAIERAREAAKQEALAL